MASNLKKAIKGLICLTFFVPLVLVPSSFIFPFIVPKILIFRSLVLLMFGGYILLLASNWQENKVRLTSVNVAVGLFLLSFTVSTFVGVDWYKSFWDNHERMLGLFTIFHFVVYYFVITSVTKEWRDWKWLLRIFLFAGMIVLVIGGMQKINPELLLNRGSDRVSATLGNAIYFSGYGLFLMFVSLLLALKEEIKKYNFWFWYAVICAFFGFFGIFWGGTKGTFLGLLTGGMILFFTYIFTTKGQKKLKYIAFSLMFLITIISGLLFNFRQTPFVRDIPAIGGLLNITLGGTTETRLMAWNIAIKAWQEKPVFGWGPNNYYYAFNKYYNPKFLEHGWGETWFDNAHSAVMNTLAVQGTAGFLAYFLLFLVPAVVLIRSFRRGKIDKHILAVGLAFLAGHFVHNATVFENPTSFLYFFFFLAFINSQVTSYKLQVISKEKEKSFSIGLDVVVGIVILLLIYSTDINPARANTATLKAMRAIYADEQNVLVDYNKTLNIPSPHIDDIRNDFANACQAVIPKLIEYKRIKSAIGCFDVSYGELQKNRALHPLDIRVNLAQSQLMLYGAQMKQDSSLVFGAEAALQDALNESPKRQQVQYSLAMIKLQLNKPQEAVRLLEDSITNDDKVGEGWARLIFVYSQIGQKDKAIALLEEAKNRNISFDERMRGIINMALPNKKE